MPLQAQGEFALVKQSMQDALQASGLPLNWGSMAHDHEMYMTLADMAAQLGDAVALQEYVPRLEELARRDGHQLYLAIAHRAAGVAHRLAGEYSKSRSRLKSALDIFQHIGARWQSGRTLTELGRLEEARSRTKPAREYFNQALAAFEGIRASSDADEIRRLIGA
ncbi:MAG: tetratricopeptide repeat protein [Chloroflexota bacterium]